MPALTPTGTKQPRSPKTLNSSTEAPGHVRVEWRLVSEIHPSPENTLIYGPISQADPEIKKLAASIRRHGLKNPIGITRDNYVFDGHRRYAACRLLGKQKIQVRVEDITRDDPKFEVLLRECNRQRVKTFDMILREQVIDFNPDTAYAALINERKAAVAVSGDFIKILGATVRSRITSVKGEMLNAVINVINEQRKYWPLSDRSIHYSLLNDPPLRNIGDPDSRYTNDRKSYKDLTDLLTRARLESYIPFNAISDPTRVVTTWQLDRDVARFFDRQIPKFLEGYCRDYQQSQPNHIEIIGEKLTVEGSIKDVAMEYCIPYTIGRGYCSLDPRRRMWERFKASGKDQLVIIALSDFDPDGVQIAHGFARSMRDDFGITNIVAKSACLTWKQVQERNLAQTFDLSDEKRKQGKFQRHLKKYGEHFHELEALSPDDRASMLRAAIHEVLDIDLYNAELEAEEEDSMRIEELRLRLGPLLREAAKDMLDL